MSTATLLNPVRPDLECPADAFDDGDEFYEVVDGDFLFPDDSDLPA